MSSESHESTIARGAALIFLGMVLSMGIGFVIRTVLIRRLPTSEYGLFALAVTIGTALTTVSTLGLNQGLARTVSRKEDDEAVRNVVLTGITSTVAVSAVFLLALVLFPELLADSLFREASLTPLLGVIGILVVCIALQTIAVATFRGKKRVYERILVKNVVSPLGRLLFIGIAVALGYEAFGVIVAWTLGVGLSTLLAVYYLYRRTTTFRIAPFDPQYRTLLGLSLPLMVSSAMWTTVQQADNILLGYYKTSTAVGIYDGAFLLTQLLLIVLSSFGFLFMPIFSELEAKNRLGQMNSVYTSVTEWAVLLVLPLYIALLFAPEAIITGVFKQSYAAGVVPLMVIASGIFVHILSGPSGDALIALGKTRIVMFGNVGAGVLNVLLNILLIPRFGIIGAAGASAGAYTLFNLFHVFWLYRETGILPFRRPFLQPLVATTAINGVVWTAGQALVDIDIVAVTAVASVLYLLHFGVIAKTKTLTKGDEQILKKLEEKSGLEIRSRLSSLR